MLPNYVRFSGKTAHRVRAVFRCNLPCQSHFSFSYFYGIIQLCFAKWCLSREMDRVFSSCPFLFPIEKCPGKWGIFQHVYIKKQAVDGRKCRRTSIVYILPRGPLFCKWVLFYPVFYSGIMFEILTVCQLVCKLDIPVSSRVSGCIRRKPIFQVTGSVLTGKHRPTLLFVRCVPEPRL